MNINTSKLTKELIAAGIAVSGCNIFGTVWAADGITEIQNQPAVAAVIAAHDPTEVPEPTLEDQIAAITAQLTAAQARIELQDQVIQELLYA